MTAEQEFDKLAGELSDHGVVAGQMFGKPTLKVGTKAIACRQGDGMAFKLGAGTAEHARALAFAGADLFDPAGMGRGMKDWVWVPVEHAHVWYDLAVAARQRLG